ncbi:MAG: COP23 domain-containing protein [Pleurocapsa sp. MO_226.B13]|nr:COP23 domain-containing protein [Pleurocapsa sp. MO_226.B13]
MMKTRFLFSFLLAVLSGLANVSTKADAQSNNSSGNIQFTCGQSYDRNTQQYIFTTFAWNSQHKKPIVTWNQETFSDAGFDPQKRCETVSPRFQEAYANQSLKFLTHGIMNGQSVICTSRQVGGECQTLLLTLLPENDPLQILEQLSDIFLGYASSPLQQSSDDPIQKVGDRVYVEVDIEEFLNQAS